jgi:hypothetical protein
MLCALVLLNVIHPGRLMPGKENDIPGRKERKAKQISKKSDMAIDLVETDRAGNNVDSYEAC